MSHTYIEAEHVNFAYDKEKTVLSDVTFAAKERDAIGVIGANGAGKSTL